MSLLTAFGVTLTFFLLVIIGMAVGVLMGRRQISGSCGGLANQSDAEGNTACSLCSNPAAACKELRSRMEEAGQRDRIDASEHGTSRCETSAQGGGDRAVECEKDCVAEGCSQEEIDACHRG